MLLLHRLLTAEGQNRGLGKQWDTVTRTCQQGGNWLHSCYSVYLLHAPHSTGTGAAALLNCLQPFVPDDMCLLQSIYHFSQPADHQHKARGQMGEARQEASSSCICITTG